MAAVVHLTSILLGCCISEVTFAAALSNANIKMPSEAWPSRPDLPDPRWERPVARAWQPHGVVPRTKQFKHSLAFNPNPAQSIAQGKVHQEKPQTNIQVAKPRTFEIKFQGPASNTEDRRSGHDHSHSHGQSQFHLESQLESPSRVSSHNGPFTYHGKHPQGSSKPGFHFSLSVPLPTTTAAPKHQSGSKFFHYPHHIPEVHKPAYQKPTGQKPAESKFVTFLSGLFNQRGNENQNSQTNTQTQSGHTPTNYWMGQMHVSGSTDAGSGGSQWFPVPYPTSDSSDIKYSILQYAKYVNGQLMIPLGKCPGFERLAAYLQSHHHQGHHHQGHHQGHHHQGHHQGHHHQGHHQGHHHQGHHQGHHHQGHHQGHHSQKPHYSKFFLNMDGAATNPNEPTQGTIVQQSAGHHEYPFKWPGTGVHSMSGGAHTQNQNNLHYVVPRKHSY